MHNGRPVSFLHQWVLSRRETRPGSAAGRVLLLADRLDVFRRPATGVGVVHLHDVLARRLVVPGGRPPDTLT
jgi:hypothetical protein